MSPIQPSKPHEGSNGVEDPATVRRTFIWLALAATVMLLPPRQWVSAGIMGVVTLGLFVWHMWKQGKAEDAKKAEAAKAAEAAKQAAAAAAALAPELNDEDENEDEDEDEDERPAPDSGEKDGTDGAG